MRGMNQVPTEQAQELIATAGNLVAMAT